MKEKILIIVFLMTYFNMAWAERPDWLSDPVKACPSTHLCAVGEGASYNAATASARNAIALIFESKIKSNLTAQETEAASSVEINIAEEINQSTEAILSGAIIIKSYEDQTTHYALAGMDKSIATKEINSKLQDIDDEMKVLSLEKNRINGEKLIKLYFKRIPLTAQLQILNGRGKPTPISYQDILQMKNLKAKGPPLKLEFTDKLGTEFEKFVMETFTSLGHSFIQNSEGSYRLVKGTISSNQEYLNIQGFVRYSVVFELSVKEADKVIGQITIKSTKTGRDQNQAIQYAINEIKNQLEDKIIELNLK